MAAWRRAIELSLEDADVERLRSIAQSRTEPASRVERARILLSYREDPSFFAVGQALGLHHQTIQRCVERAVVEGPMAALDDRPRPGKEPTITIEAKAWLTSLACRKAKELGYPHELWTTRLLARHAREHGPAQGHACLANLAQGTVCKILDQEEVKPHKVRYYLEQRDPEFAEKMAKVLCVYRKVKLLKNASVASKKKPSDTVAIISYDEKPEVLVVGRAEHRNIPNRIDKKTFGPYCWLRPEWPEQRLIRVLPDGGKGRTWRKGRLTLRGRDDNAVMEVVFAGARHNNTSRPDSDNRALREIVIHG